MADEKPISERMSVLEVRMDHHDNMLDLSMNRVADLADNLIIQVERTNTILERFEDKLNITTEKVQQWDTIARTIIKLTIAISVIIGGAWSVFEFVVDHHMVQTATETK